MEPRDRAAQAVNVSRAAHRGATGRRLRGARSALAFAQAPGLPRAGHEDRPRCRPGGVPRPRRPPVGRRSAPAASCRTRPTATSGRWVRSSGSGMCSACRTGRCSGLAVARHLCRVPRCARCSPGRCGVRSDLAVIARRARLRALAADAHAFWVRSRSRPGRGALAPWVLLPLVVGSPRGSPRRAAALAGAGGCAGGRGQRRRHLRGDPARRPVAAHPHARPAASHDDAVVAGVRARSAPLWWLVPLFVLGAYSPPFLDFIESAATTTFSTTLFDALRGTSNWVPYVDASRVQATT